MLTIEGEQYKPSRNLPPFNMEIIVKLNGDQKLYLGMLYSYENKEYKWKIIEWGSTVTVNYINAERIDYWKHL